MRCRRCFTSRRVESRPSPHKVSVIFILHESPTRLLSLLLLLCLQIAHTSPVALLSPFHATPSPLPLFLALFPIQEAARRESQLLLVPESKTPGEGSIFIPNLVSWWAHKLLPAKIATLAKMSPICLDVH